MKAGVCKSASTFATGAPRWMVYTAFALLIALAAVLIWRVVASARSPATLPGLPHTPQTEMFVEDALPKHKLVFMHMKGCGWCVRFQPVWDEFVRANAPLFGKCALTAEDFERTVPGAKAYDAHVQGYPTVLLVKDTPGEERKVTKFEGERTAEGLSKFLEDQDVWKLERAEDGSMQPVCKRPIERFSDQDDEVFAKQIKHVGDAVSKASEGVKAAGVGMKMGAGRKA